MSGPFCRTRPSAQALPLVEVSDLSRVRVTFFVGQIDATLVHEGTRAIMRTDPAPLRKIQATITRTTRALDMHTRTLQCEIELPNADQDFRQAARCTSISLPRRPVRSRYERSLFFRRAQPNLTLARGGHAKIVPVEIGDDDGIKLRVLSGVRVGDSVVVHGIAEIADGAEIEAIPTADRTK